MVIERQPLVLIETGPIIEEIEIEMKRDNDEQPGQNDPVDPDGQTADELTQLTQTGRTNWSPVSQWPRRDPGQWPGPQGPLLARQLLTEGLAQLLTMANYWPNYWSNCW